MIEVTVSGDAVQSKTTLFRAVAGVASGAAVVIVILLLLQPGMAQKRKQRVQWRGDEATVIRAAQHEVEALESPTSNEFCAQVQWEWGSETRDVIETPEGRADRIIAFHGQPLAEDQTLRQERRLEKLLTDRKAARDEIEDQAAEKKRRIRMMKALPDAFVFEFIGQDQNGDWMFSFRPNPKFSPKDKETEVYRGMEGTLWIHPEQERITRIEGVLYKDVGFGWGILGKLYKGGRYEIRQTPIAPGVWRITTLNLNLRGRSLFDSFRVFRLEGDSHFRPTPPDMSYTDAVQALLRAKGLRTGERAGLCPVRGDAQLPN